jgi:hypothetical protein
MLRDSIQRGVAGVPQVSDAEAAWEQFAATRELLCASRPRNSGAFSAHRSL